jgi:hypothetical protein
MDGIMKNTKIYHYAENGIFISLGYADRCQITGVDLIPAYSTTIEPLAVALPELAIWTGEAWGVFKPEPEPEPTISESRAAMVISKVKAMQNLKKAGKLNAVLDLMDTLPRDNDVRILWDYSENLHRTDTALVKVCKEQLKLTDLQIDAIFTQP